MGLGLIPGQGIKIPHAACSQINQRRLKKRRKEGRNVEMRLGQVKNLAQGNTVGMVDSTCSQSPPASHIHQPPPEVIHPKPERFLEINKFFFFLHRRPRESQSESVTGVAGTRTKALDPSSSSLFAAAP